MNQIIFLLISYLLFPNIKIGILDIKDFFLIIYMAINYKCFLKGFHKYSFILTFPSMMVVISFTIKLLIGYSFNLDDFKEVLRHFSMIIFIFILFGQLSKFSKDDFYQLIQKIQKTVIAYLIIISCFAFFQKYNYSLFEKVIGNFYVLEQIGTEQVKGLSFTNHALSEALDRVSTIYYTPIVFAYALSLLVIYLIYTYKGDNSFKYWISIILCLITIVLTNTRAVLIVLMLVFPLRYLSKKSLIKLFIFSPLLIIIGSFLYDEFTSGLNKSNFHRIEEITLYIGSGLDSHFMPDNLALRINDIEMIFTKIDIWEIMVSGLPADHFLSIIGMGFHSQYVSFIIKFGIWGIFIILWMLYINLKTFSIYRKNFEDKLLSSQMLAMVMIFLAINLISFSQITLFQDRIRFFFFIVLAISFQLYINKINDRFKIEKGYKVKE